MDGNRLLNTVGVVLVLAVVGGVVFVGALVVNPPENPQNAPEVNWTLERANDTHVRIVHAGGEPLGADELLVSVDGNRREFATSDPTVGEGDELVVRAAEGTNVELHWTGGERGAVFLARWRA